MKNIDKQLMKGNLAELKIVEIFQANGYETRISDSEYDGVRDVRVKYNDKWIDVQIKAQTPYAMKEAFCLEHWQYDIYKNSNDLLIIFVATDDIELKPFFRNKIKPFINKFYGIWSSDLEGVIDPKTTRKVIKISTLFLMGNLTDKNITSKLARHGTTKSKYKKK